MDAGLARILRKSGTRLGFGTGKLSELRGQREQQRLLETAYDQGMTYFDTARLYGEGRTESVVGAFLKGRRDQIVLASKAGILPTRAGLAARAAERITHAARRLPPVRSVLAEPKYREPVFGVFAPAEVRSSVETSLRELRTDYLDVFLLHEPALTDIESDDLRDLIERLQGEGKILNWGAAPVLPVAREAIVDPRRPVPPIVQFAFEPSLDGLTGYREAGVQLTVLHTVIAQWSAGFLAELGSSPALADLARGVGLNPADQSAVGRQLLALALAANPEGIVLFSTLKPDRIVSNIKAAREPAHQVAAVRTLLAEWSARNPAAA